MEKQGLACGGCGGCNSCIKSNAYTLLGQGSPRLAYAAASGVPLSPWELTCSATFSTTTQAVAANKGNEPKIVQDTIIDRIDYHIQNVNTPTSNFSSFAANQFALNSGIQARLKVIGTPRFSVADEFMPIELFVRKTCGWLLSATNGVSMDFQSTMTLPFVPIEVTVVFHGRTAIWKRISEISPQFAIQKLKEMGYDIGPYAALFE